LLSIPNISKKRDPLFWGKLLFDGGSVSLINNDSHFDMFAETADI
jgi:hypothetical protein